MKNTEYEYKQLITVDTYNILMSNLDNITNHRDIIQINYYYDDESFSLFEKDETLRVRQKQDQLILERKYNIHYSVNGEKISEEHYDIVEKFPMKINIDNKDYYYIGNLITLRKDYIIGDNINSRNDGKYIRFVKRLKEIPTQ